MSSSGCNGWQAENNAHGLARVRYWGERFSLQKQNDSFLLKEVIFDLAAMFSQCFKQHLNLSGLLQ